MPFAAANSLVGSSSNEATPSRASPAGLMQWGFSTGFGPPP